eukprot:6181948-Pleurochrysis_carterae.AAC.1
MTMPVLGAAGPNGTASGDSRLDRSYRAIPTTDQPTLDPHEVCEDDAHCAVFDTLRTVHLGWAALCPKNPHSQSPTIPSTPRPVLQTLGSLNDCLPNCHERDSCAAHCQFEVLQIV